LRFRGFEEEWENKKLGEVAEISRGKSKHRPRNATFLYGGKYPFVQTGDIKNAGLFLETYSQTYSEAGLKQSKLWNKNTLCITIAANIAETTILKIKACFPDSVIGLIPRKNQSNIIFIKYQFDNFKSDVQKLSQGAAQANLNQESLSNVLFAFPSFTEQNKIADFLSLIDERISTQIQIIKELGTLIKGLIRSFIRKEVMNIQLKNCLNCHSSTLMESAVIEKKGTYPVYGATGIIAYTPSYEIDKESILIIKDGASVGKVQYAKDKYSVIGTLNYLTPKENVSLKYFYYYLQTFNFEKYKVGSGIPHIYFKNYGDEYIYCPPIETQTKIANFLSAIAEKLETEKQLLKKYTEQKKYLLANMFI